MKLPHHLLRTYRRYKEEEQSLLSWIERVAAESGHELQNRKEKLKGRARTLARRGNAKCESDIQGTTITQCKPMIGEATISILNILPLVAAIAQNSQICLIPAEVAQQFLTVLDLRTSCLRWFKGNTTQQDSETRKRNEKHTIPVTILREAISLLKPKFPPQQTIPSNMASVAQVSTVVPKATKNLFELLSVEEGNEEPLGQLASDNGFTHQSLDTESLKQLELSREERLQDEFNVAKFCLLRDVQQVEDFMVLELIRYSLDKANSDVLPFLCNVSMDIVMRMEALLYQSFDWRKSEEGFLNTVVLPNDHVVFSSPILRMQEVISTQRKRLQGVTRLKMHNTKGLNFSSNHPYFGESIHQQMLVEQVFVEHLLRLERDGVHRNRRFYGDMVPECIKSFLTAKVGGENYYAVPTGSAFGIRLALLMAMILNDQPLLPIDQYSDTGSNYAQLEASHEKFWASPEYRSGRVAKLWPGWEPVLRAQKLSYTTYNRSIAESKPALSAYHVMCTLNNCHIRKRYADTSITAMEMSNVVKILAHLWNLFREEKRLDGFWPDMNFLLSNLGEDFMFQSTRPVNVHNRPDVIRSRIAYGMGFTKKQVSKVINSSNEGGFTKVKFRHKERQKLPSSPLYSLLTKRCECPVSLADGAVDAELVATAIVIPDIIGQEPQIVKYNIDAQITNKNDLWKHRDQGPGLQPTELLAIVKRGLQKEFKVMDFDYLRFEQATLELVAKITDEITHTLSLNPKTFSRGSLLQKLEYTTFCIIEDVNFAAVLKIAAIFERWLQTNGHVGVKGLCIAEQRPVDPKTQSSSLSPRIFNIVKTIVSARGLREDVFSVDQIDVDSIAVTESLGAVIKAAWADHKGMRKMRKLESGRFTHPDLDLS